MSSAKSTENRILPSSLPEIIDVEESEIKKLQAEVKLLKRQVSFLGIKNAIWQAHRFDLPLPSELEDEDAFNISDPCIAALSPANSKDNNLFTLKDKPLANIIVSQYFQLAHLNPNPTIANPARYAPSGYVERFKDLIACDVVLTGAPKDLAKNWATGRYGGPLAGRFEAWLVDNKHVPLQKLSTLARRRAETHWASQSQESSQESSSASASATTSAEATPVMDSPSTLSTTSGAPAPSGGASSRGASSGNPNTRSSDRNKSSDRKNKKTKR